MSDLFRNFATQIYKGHEMSQRNIQTQQQVQSQQQVQQQTLSAQYDRLANAAANAAVLSKANKFKYSMPARRTGTR